MRPRIDDMWRIEFDPHEKRLEVCLTEEVGLASLRALARAHAEALEATGGLEFTVFVDMRGVIPLDDECVRLFADMKRVCASMPRFRAMAVLVDGATVAMQQQRTAIPRHASGARELVTFDEAEALRFLASPTLA